MNTSFSIEQQWSLYDRLCGSDQRGMRSHEYMLFAAVYEISLVLAHTFFLCAHKACVWSQRCVGLGDSHPAVEKPLKCSLVALRAAAIHGHILLSAAATWLCLQGAPKARSVTGNKWYGAGNRGEQRNECWDGEKGREWQAGREGKVGDWHES